ncbi:MAG: hypothetical protein ACLGI6_02170 [Gammaproteobacteria bacterium]
MQIPSSLPRALLALLLAAVGTLVAAQGTAPIPSVVVPYVRDPVDKSYRKMIKGMDRFEREHALAPGASLRFRLLPRRPGTRMEGITLRIAGDTLSIPVKVEADNSFVLERNAQAYEQDAAVVANRKTDSMTWRVEFRSPGLAPGTRRLGDLRLECRVGMDAGLISNSAPIFGWLSNLLTDTDKVCNSPDGNYLFFADRPIFGVTLRHGETRMDLPFRLLYAPGNQTPDTRPFCDCEMMLDRSFYAPIWDARWPDDTILEFDYMDEAPR